MCRLRHFLAALRNRQPYPEQRQCDGLWYFAGRKRVGIKELDTKFWLLPALLLFC
jgi:hypothetical protein